MSRWPFRNVERSAQWYADVLGFKREHEGMWNGVPVFIGNGAAAIALFPARDKAGSMSHDRAAVRTLHFAFRTDRKNFLRAQDELKKNERFPSIFRIASIGTQSALAT